MSNQNKTTITKQPENKKIIVVREFDAPLEKVWKAWTESSLLDQWWAPRPWKAATKSMDFREGGFWLYAMEGPDGERHWARVDYRSISAPNSFVAEDAFCDEDGNKTSEMPSMTWNTQFSNKGGATEVRVEISFEKEEDMNKIIEMGFQEGFSAAHENLDELLKS